MAQRVTVTLEDDLDSGPAAERLRFAVGGSDYEIDLSTKNAAALRKQHGGRPTNALGPGRADRGAAPRLTGPRWPLCIPHCCRCPGGTSGLACLAPKQRWMYRSLAAALRRGRRTLRG